MFVKIILIAVKIILLGGYESDSYYHLTPEFNLKSLCQKVQLGNGNCCERRFRGRRGYICLGLSGKSKLDCAWN